MVASGHIAVIDIGKTNIKLAIVDAETLEERAVSTMPNRVLPGPPYPHFDTDGIWAFLLAELAGHNRACPLDAISVTTHGASGALLDAGGELALPVLDYEYDGPEIVAPLYDAIRPPFAETGSPRLAGGLNLGAQIFWQFQTFPEAANTVAAIVTYPQFWAHKLSGVLATEVTSLGCHTDLWRPETGAFSSMVAKQGWAGLMAPVRRADDMLGHLRPDIAEKTGLSPQTQVHCGIHDSNASLYPYIIRRRAPFSVVSTGTWVVCMTIGGKKVELDPERDTLVNVNARGDPVPSARFMGGREFDTLISGDASCSSKDIETVLAEKIMLLPAVETQTGPFKGRQHVWSHPEAELKAGIRFAAASFYLAMMTATCLELTGAEGPAIVEGPFAKNDAYLSMLRSAVGRPVSVSETATGTSTGAAMLVTAGRHLDEQPPCDDQAGNTAMRDYARRWSELAG
ncbi:FGGY-family carbohydrate kinase [Hoeflea sp. TYP-13]|uniref:FGGY-family carbohydrate kinase n=1 Tax=Hoeflea sp. TYP-13 TaxID=3230023 RepID=UPI0034C5D690